MKWFKRWRYSRLLINLAGARAEMQALKDAKMTNRAVAEKLGKLEEKLRQIKEAK